MSSTPTKINMDSEFEKFWAANVGMFNSCKSVSRLAAALAWNAAMTVAASEVISEEQYHISDKLLEHKTKL
jgi:hypothetical protein